MKVDEEKNLGDALITVCDNCLQASCWQGEFYCDEYKTAGVTQKTRAELAALKLEHPSYWKTDDQLAGSPAPVGTIRSKPQTISEVYQGIIERAGKARAELAEMLGVPAVWPAIIEAVKEAIAKREEN